MLGRLDRFLAAWNRRSPQNQGESGAGFVEALKEVRETVVLAIAFLARDFGGDRAKITVPQVIESLVVADRRLLAIAAQKSTPSQEPRPEVRAFADLMEAQLRANDHKPGWKNDFPSDLWERLREEATELVDAIGFWGKQKNWGEMALHMPRAIEDVGREAADVANFAMMIADVCGALAAAPSPSPVGEKEEGSSRDHDLTTCAATPDGAAKGGAE